MDTKKKYFIGIWICVILIFILEGLLYFHSNWKSCLIVKPGFIEILPGKRDGSEIIVGTGFEFQIKGEYQIQSPAGETIQYYKVDLGDDFSLQEGYILKEKCAIRMGKVGK